MKTGFIAVVGRPNAGKTTLINKMTGEKVGIVSPKPQTTRDRTLGVVTRAGEYQMVFIDTPGVFKPKNGLGRYMMKNVSSALSGADGVLLVLDAERGLAAEDGKLLETLSGVKNVFVAVNKTDAAGFERVYPVLESLKEYKFIKETVPCCAQRGDNVEKIKGLLSAVLPEGEPHFDADAYTDKPVRYLAGETVREKALLYLNDEIPHGVGVYVQSFDDAGRVVKISADIICEKENHKRIIIGGGGAALKRIGAAARADMEKLLGKKVFLSLFVKVREGWRDDEAQLSNLDYKN